MKPVPFNIPKANNNYLIYQEDIGLYFYDKYHQHEEFQISYIEKGLGTLVVGDTINEFQENDVLIFGNNLPHVFKNYVHNNRPSIMLTLFFRNESKFKELLGMEDLKVFRPIIESAKVGIKIRGADKNLQKSFRKLKGKGQSELFIEFFHILENVRKSKMCALSTFSHKKPFNDQQGKRMQRIIDFSMNNYTTDIKLENVAKIANLTVNAFCKYFKTHTDKTFFQFLNELRVNQATKLLASEKDLLVEDIAELSGFRNVSNFNRQFKKLTKMTPSLYRGKNLEHSS